MIFYSYTPWPYMNGLNEFDLQFKIFTLVDTTKSYVILNESINKLLSVSQSIVSMGYECPETNFNDHNRQTCLDMLWDHIRQKSQKTNIQRSSNGTMLFDGYKRKITI